MKMTIIIFVTIIALVFATQFLVTRPKASPQVSSVEYVSDENCRRCHKQESEEHNKSSHSMGFEALIDLGEGANPKCLPCHTTGYKKPGGFVDRSSTPGMATIGCQACHGPGSAHIKSGLSKEQRRQTINQNPEDYCISCHSIHNHHDLGKKAVPYLKKKIERLQKQVKGK